MTLLQELLKICKPYDDEKYVFKKCCDVLRKDKSRKWLVILEKTDETKTNEGRENIVNPDTAKYRASVLKVVRIINLNDPKKSIKYLVNRFPGPDTGLIANFYHDTKYVVKKKVKEHFDENVETVCGPGIHYFKSIEPAILYYTPPQKYSGTMIEWYDNGALLAQGEVEGTKGMQYLYARATRVTTRKGPWTEWTNDGKKHVAGYYDEKGNATGTWTRYYPSGQVALEGSFLDDRKTGKWTSWDTQGNVISEKIFDAYDWLFARREYEDYAKGPLSYKIGEKMIDPEPSGTINMSTITYE